MSDMTCGVRKTLEGSIRGLRICWSSMHGVQGELFWYD